MVYRKDESLRCATYPELLKSAELLKYICDNNITGEDRFKTHVDEADERYRADRDCEKEIRVQIELEEKILANGDRFLELSEKTSFKPDEIAELKTMNYMFKQKIKCHDDLEVHRKKLEKLKSELVAAEEKAAVSKSERDRAGELYRTYLEQSEGEFGKLRRMIEEESKHRQERERDERSSTRQRSNPAARYR